MDVFGFGTEEGSRPLLPPGLCWVCDNSPTQEAEKVIDTRRNSRPGPHAIHTTERKYVCESCAKELGKAIGLIGRDEFDKVVDELRDASLERDRLQARLERAESEQVRVIGADEVAALIDEKLSALKPKPAARTKAAVAE